ncbi:hypothetical protein CDAR_515851 [Caerostris darwini]|uniref:Uncharacterized protein n=1 Tax=Caerostris darwini TaxID=1538125 RepID=A0AAV4PTT3_9ARAC|nr:hypothetical protein CDAR_515851 [Caerostris darwini]
MAKLSSKQANHGGKIPNKPSSASQFMLNSSTSASQKFRACRTAIKSTPTKQQGQRNRRRFSTKSRSLVVNRLAQNDESIHLPTKPGTTCVSSFL